MGRKVKWPPQPRAHHISGRERVRWRGHDYYIGPIGGDNAQEYAALLVRLAAAESDKPQPGEPPRILAGAWPTISGAIAKWLEWATGHYGERDEFRHYKRVIEVLLSLHRDLTTDGFGIDDLDDVRKAMGEKGWCRNHINRQTIRIKTIWRRLERLKLAPRGSWAHLHSLRPIGKQDRQHRSTEPVRPAEWPAIIAVCRRLKPMPRAMLLFMWFTGCRTGEVRVMRACEVDRAGEEWVFPPAKHKTAHLGHVREIVMGTSAQKVLAPWLEGKNGDDFVFVGQRGPYSRWGLTKAVRAAAEEAGVQLHPYQCRHAAKQRVTRALGLDFARSYLGQKSIQVTDGYGQQTDLEMAKQVARRLG